MRKRRSAGIDRAKRKGTKFGRPAALDASQKKHIAERYAPVRQSPSWRASMSAQRRPPGGHCETLSAQAPREASKSRAGWGSGLGTSGYGGQ
jgi:hypothetical protein